MRVRDTENDSCSEKIHSAEISRTYSEEVQNPNNFVLFEFLLGRKIAKVWSKVRLHYCPQQVGKQTKATEKLKPIYLCCP